MEWNLRKVYVMSNVNVKLATYDFVKKGEHIYFCSFRHSKLFRFNLENKSCEMVGAFDDEVNEDLYISVVEYEERIVFVPEKASRIAVYDMGKKSIDFITFEKPKGNHKERYENAILFSGGFSYGQYVYLLGFGYPGIIKIDMTTYDLVYINDWVGEVERHINEGDYYGYFSCGVCIEKGTAIIPLGCMKGVIKIDLKTDATKVIEIDVPSRAVGGITYFNDSYFVVPRGESEFIKSIYVFDEQLKSIKKVIALPSENESYTREDPFRELIIYGDALYLLPISANNIYKIEKDTYALTRIEKIKFESPISRGDQPRVMAAKIVDNHFIMIDQYLKWYDWDLAKDEIDSFECITGEDTVRDDNIRLIKDKNSIIHEERMSLGEYIAALTHM